jgi:hypothetical protein
LSILKCILESSVRLLDPKSSSKPTHEEIALHAYNLWIDEGCPRGRDQEYWLRAEEELMSELQDWRRRRDATPSYQ